MDTYGFVIFFGSLVVWLFTRGKNPNLASWSIFGMGIGVGIVLGALGSFLIITHAFGG